MEKRLKFLKFFAKSVILDEKFLIFLLCNALSNAYKNSYLFSFSKGFLGAFLIGFVVYYAAALIPKRPLQRLLEWLFIGSGIVFSVAEIFTLFMFKMPFSKGLIDTLLATNGSETMAFVKSYNNYLLYYAFILIALLIAIKTIRFRALVPGVIASVLGLSILTIGSVRHVKYLTNSDAILKRSLRSLSLARRFHSAYLSLTEKIKNIAKTIYRTEFHEITKSGVEKGLNNAVLFSQSNLNLYYSWLGRIVSDQFVGFTLTPYLRKNIKNFEVSAW